MPKSIVLIGKHGQVGRSLVACLSAYPYFYALGRQDIAACDSIAALLNQLQPALIINAAAYTQVDLAEQMSTQAYQDNALLPALLAQYAADSDCGLIHFSTDYVFSGQAGYAYEETDLTHPVNEYGRTKLAGEHFVSRFLPERSFIFRLSRVYSPHGEHFATRLYHRLLREGFAQVVDDQAGHPTSSDWVAAQIYMILKPYLGEQALSDLSDFYHRAGCYHLVPDQWFTLFEYAQHLLNDWQSQGQLLGASLSPTSTALWQAKQKTAPRPLLLRLNNKKFIKNFTLSV